MVHGIYAAVTVWSLSFRVERGIGGNARSPASSGVSFVTIYGHPDTVSWRMSRPGARQHRAVPVIRGFAGRGTSLAAAFAMSVSDPSARRRDQSVPANSSPRLCVRSRPGVGPSNPRFAGKAPGGSDGTGSLALPHHCRPQGFPLPPGPAPGTAPEGESRHGVG